MYLSTISRTQPVALKAANVESHYHNNKTI